MTVDTTDKVCHRSSAILKMKLHLSMLSVSTFITYFRVNHQIHYFLNYESLNNSPNKKMYVTKCTIFLERNITKTLSQVTLVHAKYNNIFYHSVLKKLKNILTK